VITETTVVERDETPATAADGLHLLVISAASVSAQRLPAIGTVIIGRSSRCGVHIADPMASREHVRLHILGCHSGVPSITVEDANSANGTRVRGVALEQEQRVTLALGEEISIGSTVMMVIGNRGPNWIRSYASFEARLVEECARAADGNRTFALARLRLGVQTPWNNVMPLLARELSASDFFAAYSPRHYEICFVDAPESVVDSAVRRLISSCNALGLDASCGVAWYPKNGKTSDALLASAGSLLKVHDSHPRSAALVAGSMQRVRDMAAKVAHSGINVMILGECGVGKDVLAQLVHKLSPRAEKPFVAINCAGLAPSLMESELFGHEKGAFTGAISSRVGLLESANGGTVFLDEVGDMPLAMQVALLRVIESREIRPVGALKSRAINVRFISATNRDLDAAVAKGTFREELKFRLDVVTLHVPPLRERKEEIPELARSFVSGACGEASGAVRQPAIGDEVMRLLMRYRWPGNVRELKNVMERAVALCDGLEIEPRHLPIEKIGEGHDIKAGETRFASMTSLDLPALADPEATTERRTIIEALLAENWNQTRAARRLNMPRRTFIMKLDQYALPRPQKAVKG